MPLTAAGFWAGKLGEDTVIVADFEALVDAVPLCKTADELEDLRDGDHALLDVTAFHLQTVAVGKTVGGASNEKRPLFLGAEAIDILRLETADLVEHDLSQQVVTAGEHFLA